jgi:hypothetical protein
MKKSKTKKVLKGKNKFIRLDDANLKFVINRAKELKRSQNWVINEAITEARALN